MSIRRRISCISLFWVLFYPQILAQKFEVVDSLERGSFNCVWTRGFWDNWFVQAGLDLAVGKWFTPQVGVRGKFNWENKLPLLENGHANWLAPFYEPGVNREKGGYTVDVMVSL